MSDSTLRQRTRTIAWDDPLVGARAAATMPGLDYLRAMGRGELPFPPIMALMDMGVVVAEEGRVVFSVEPAEYHYNPIGTVHGGVACTLCDSAMGCAIHTTLPAGTGYTTLELKVNFLRPITATTGRLLCEGKVIHVGGRTAIAEARMTDEAGKLYAHATTTCLILRPASEQPR
ncbi:MAG TPA: PaaI family thioesterase [Roseiflexaceae bacterium]